MTCSYCQKECTKHNLKKLEEARTLLNSLNVLVKDKYGYKVKFQINLRWSMNEGNHLSIEVEK